MKAHTPLMKQDGFTLLEAITAMVILTFGILAVAAMQGSAIRASTVSYNRTEATSLATAFAETVMNLPFDDSNLEKTAEKLPSKYDESSKGETRTMEASSALAPADLDKKPLLKLITWSDGAGQVRDRAGIQYTMRWAVEAPNPGENAKKQPINNGEPIFKNIRLFLIWDTPYGPNHLTYTMTKNDK